MDEKWRTAKPLYPLLSELNETVRKPGSLIKFIPFFIKLVFRNHFIDIFYFFSRREAGFTFTKDNCISIFFILMHKKNHRQILGFVKIFFPTEFSNESIFEIILSIFCSSRRKTGFTFTKDNVSIFFLSISECIRKIIDKSLYLWNFGKIFSV